MNLSSASRFLDYLLLLLLLTRPPGIVPFIIKVPAVYTVLQGELIVQVIFPEQTTTELPPDETEDGSTKGRVENDAITEGINSDFIYDSSDNEINSGFTESSINNAEDSRNNQLDYSIRAESPTNPQYKNSVSSTPILLNLYTVDSRKPIKKLRVPADGSQTNFSFPCGIIVHGGLHIVRLKRNRKILAENRSLNVSWPPLIIKIPVVLETYRSPADIQFSFTTAHRCLPMKPKAFETWVELLYHGSETEISSPTGLPPQGLRQATEDSRKVSLSSSRLQRRSALTSLEGSIILSKSNSNIKPEVIKKWSWDGSSGAKVVQRVHIVNQLYSKGKHEVRFGCEVIGPAGKYSVRIVTNVPTNPVISQSDTFLVEWDEAFKLEVPRTYLTPCSIPVPVTYSQPLCVGKKDKIRLYAHIRANVSSANPPIYPRYITERRAINRNTNFDCKLFTDEPTEYCFVYVNTASWGAVSYVRTQCVATFKSGVLRTDGQWGEWSSWSDCTATCGAGVQIKHRFCDNPAPRNGGKFCRGLSLTMKNCGDHLCTPPQLEEIPSSILPAEEDYECRCGCFVDLVKDDQFAISASAADCSGTTTWTFQAPPETIVVAELVRATLLGGSQWLKVRDGGNSSSPLLVSLPSFSSATSRDAVPPKIASTKRLLSVFFRSDINISYVGNAWGFTMRLEVSVLQPRLLEWNPHSAPTKFNLTAFHITVIAMGVNVLVAITCYLAYYCERYPAYKKSLLEMDDSPLETPNGSPNHQRTRILVTSTASTTTLTEVLSLKSFKFGMRKNSSSSYTRLAREGDLRKKIMRSLPSSPMLSSARFPFIKRSPSQLLRRIKNKNTNRKIQNRRSASFDQLRIDISPIYEDLPILPNSVTLEYLTKKSDSFDEPNLKKGEDHADKYKEYRKSMLASKRICETMNLDTSKLSKDRVNQKLHHLKMRRDGHSASSGETGMRTSSSVSELSMASGVDLEMEYDYYDYDVGNASAVPGSLFGIDPTIMPWMIDIDDLDIKTPEQLAAARSIDNCALISPPPPHETGEEIPMQTLNIPPDPLQQSCISNESNESNDVTPRPGQLQTTKEDLDHDEDDDLTPRNEEDIISDEEKEAIKILNIHEVEDFQFADDSDEDI